MKENALDLPLKSADSSTFGLLASSRAPAIVCASRPSITTSLVRFDEAPPPPDSLVSCWLWRLRHHNQQEKNLEGLRSSKPPAEEATAYFVSIIGIKQ